MKASECIDAIAELREQRGWTIKRIADHLGCSPGAVSWQCLINGIEMPGEQKFAAQARPGAVCKRGDHEVKRFTADEDSRLIAFDAEGLSHSEMGRRLGRRANSVRGRLATLARLEERSLARSSQRVQS